ncbi:acyl-CoA synthetase [Halocynthiibacter styelae]|uniref:Acyl-CoA synthetase n=1 Tax=Halocynthiibacter styelae TaxID=2761955 RepID=A0A8J7ICK6_9RHOB|nr:acyl-CoA synthetase [Paenihalocynthiibacter styelae]MBI1493468.1 acyl-CoA synthetase [Paenihalocynthiibacter styelae]
MGKFASLEDLLKIEQEAESFEARDLPRTMHDFLASAKDKNPNGNAISYQITSGPKDKAETQTWTGVYEKSVQAANLFRSLGVGENDVVAFLLPNAMETAYTLLGGMISGIVNPINPLLDPEQISAILRETNATVLVTLKAFPKTDVPQKAAEALKDAPNVKTVLEIDLLRYLTPPKSWIVPLIRPKNPSGHSARVLNFNAEMAKQNKTLDFEDKKEDRVAAYFHTGGTTGMPKVAQHKYSGMIYNGWLGSTLLFRPEDNVMCPLPLFHVFAVYPIMMSMIGAASHVIFPTPAGYRGDGVFDNFWKLCERYKVTFLVTVPTALSALMQRPIDADISTLSGAFSGSSPLPLELYRRFEEATGVQIIEGYGLTEATCLVSCNPPGGNKKTGSVGMTFPHCDVKILKNGPDGPVECGTDEIGEICIDNPGVFEGSTYTEVDKNHDLFHHDVYLRTGDLGRIDAEGYLFITGRAKDLIIRGGHNIDPAEIEEALAGHPAVGFVGAIGQPDGHAGEIPCAYVELVEGASVTSEELMAYAKEHIHERAANPKYIEIMAELPKTAVGKVFKPDLRKSAITRIYNAALTESGVAAQVTVVIDDKKRGLVAQLVKTGDVADQAVVDCLGKFTRPWEWAN